MDRKLPSAANSSPARRHFKRALIRLGVILAVAGYLFAQPWLERQFGPQLPPQEPAGQQTVLSGDSDLLTEIRPDVFRSPAGLVYTPGSRHGHRLAHVMAHAHDEPERPGPHGVFESKDQTQVVRLVDEAYQLTQQGRGDPTGTDSERQVWTVDMRRDIGFVGGQVGRQRGHPRCHELRIVLEGTRVVTAFPVD